MATDAMGGPGAPGPVARWQQLICFVNEHDRWHGRPLYLEMLELVRAQGGAGATVLRGVAGYSATGRLIQATGHRAPHPNLPLAVVVVDTAAHIAALLPGLDAMLAEVGGVIAVTDLAAYVAHHPGRPATPGAPFQKVGQIMETDVVAVPPDMPVADLLPLLLNKPYKAVPVIDAERHVLGMVTDGDLLRATGSGLSLSVLEAIQAQGEAGLAEVLRALRARGQTARDVMGVRPEAVIGPDATIDAAARLMVQQGVKRLPVVDHERRLLGILGRVDVLRVVAHVGTAAPEPAAPGPPPAGAPALQDVLLPDVPTVLPDAPLSQVVAAVVGSHHARRVVVIDDPAARHVLGIITAADLVRRSATPAQAGVLRMMLQGFQFVGTGLGAPPPLPESWDLDCARDVMTTPVITAPATLSLPAAIALMVEHRVKGLPVLDAQGRLAGLVTRQRLLQGLIGPAPAPEA